MKLKMLFVNLDNTISHDPVPLIYPLGMALDDFIVSLNPAFFASFLKPEYNINKDFTFYIPHHETPVARINNEDFLDNGYLHIVCNLSPRSLENQQAISFLQGGQFLETDLQLSEVTSIGAFPLDRRENYKGIAHLDISGAAGIETIEFSYYNDSGVFLFTCDVNAGEENYDLQIVPKPLPVHFFKDIAANDVEFEFDTIESALRHDNLFLVDCSTVEGERNLLTFKQETEELVFRNTGNRILSRDLFKNLPLPHLDIGYARGTPIGKLLPALGKFVQRLIDKDLEVCDIEASREGDYNFLSWCEDKQVAGIYHVSADAPLATEPNILIHTVQKPCALAWLSQLQAFVMSLEGSTELYLIDSLHTEIDLASLPDISPVFDHQDSKFATSGNVMEMYSRRYGGNDLLLIVQERKIGLNIIKPLT